MLSGQATVYVSSETTDEEGLQVFEKAIVGIVTPGTGFGELALINSKPRAATVECTMVSVFAVLEKADYLRILKKFDLRRLNFRIDFFKAVPVFSNWTRQSIGKLSYYFKEVEYSRNSYVYREEDLPDSVYFVKQGDFNLLKAIPNSSHTMRRANKLRAHVAILGLGEMFGNEEVMNRLPRQHSCQCASSSGTLLVIDHQDFIKKVAFSRNLETLTNQTSLRQAEHDRRLKEFEAVRRLSNLKSGRVLSDSPIQESRSLSKVGQLADSPPLVPQLSFEVSRPDKPVRTMTNLARLPNLSARFRKGTVSPVRVTKRGVVNMHTKALRDKQLRHYTNKPYMKFVEQ
jgi:CRP-like cAMP-binding protein